MLDRRLLITLTALAACGGAGDGTDTAGATGAATADTVAGAATAAAAGETSGFDVPESVRYDPDLDVYFVSNINGNPSNKDNNGYIARVHPDSTSAATRFIEGGKNGVTLNAPKGMAIVGDTLWVADIDVVRGFDKRTGASVATIDFAAQRATFLNDVAAAPDGIYVTDTNVRFAADGSMSSPGTDAVYHIAGREIHRIATGDSLGRPNGVTWDAQGSRLIIVPFNGKRLLTLSKSTGLPTSLGADGPGQYDGVEVLGNGRIAVSSWADSSVHVANADGSGLRKLVGGLNAPADIGYDTKRNLLLVPLFNDGVVRYFRLP